MRFLLLLACLTSAYAQSGARYMNYRRPETGSVARTVEDKLSEFRSLQDFGAKCNSQDGGAHTDDSAAIQAAINAVCALPATSNRTITVPGSCSFSQTIQVSCEGVSLVGGGGFGFRGQSKLTYTGVGVGFKLGDETTPDVQDIISAARASGTVTLTVADTSKYPLTDYITVKGAGSFNATSAQITAKTSSTISYAQAGADETGSGGTVDHAWETFSSWVDTTSGFTLRNLNLTCENAGASVSLDNGLDTYVAGTTFIQDWYGGQMIFDNVRIAHCETGIFGVRSDQDEFSHLWLYANHVGVHLDAQSDQAHFPSFLMSGANDTALEFNAIKGWQIRHWTSNNDGSETRHPLMMWSDWAAVGGGDGVCDDCWWENYGGYTGIEAFASVGVKPDGSASPQPVRNITFRNPVLMGHAYRTRNFVRLENAHGISIEYPHWRPDGGFPNPGFCLAKYTGSSSPNLFVKKDVDIGCLTDVTESTGTPITTTMDVQNGVKIKGNLNVTGDYALAGAFNHQPDPARHYNYYKLGADAGYAAEFEFATGYTMRWALVKTGDAETGSSVGSNFELRRYDDAGSYVDRPFWVARNTGQTTINDLRVWALYPNGTAGINLTCTGGQVVVNPVYNLGVLTAGTCGAPAPGTHTHSYASPTHVHGGVTAGSAKTAGPQEP